MVSDRFANERFKAGYSEGFIDGYNAASRQVAMGERTSLTPHGLNLALEPITKQTKKRKQSGKAKLLTQMTAPVWKKYKKGSGKKTYVQIRAQVSRSQAYKRKAKKL